MAAARLLAGALALCACAWIGGADAADPPAAVRVAQVKWDDVLWNTIKGGDDPALFERYLKRFPQGAHADEARRRIDALKSAPPAKTQVVMPEAPAAPKPPPAASAAAPAAPASPGRPADGRYAEPRIGGVRLDWCLSWARDCGQPAADEFCLRQGYAGAGAFTRATGVPPTRIISDDQICDLPDCSSFAAIACIGTGSKAPASKAGAQAPGEFRAPRVNQALVDHCLHWGRDCGKPAADAFCRLAGFTAAAAFERARPGQRSYVLGDKLYCEQPGCVGFARISCRGRN